MRYLPNSLGAKLARDVPEAPWHVSLVYWLLQGALVLVGAVVLWIIAGLWGQHPNALLIAGVGATLAALVFALWSSRLSEEPAQEPHFLLANDRQGFMADLLLDTKTAVFDGSNIYHFGQQNGLDVQPIGLLAAQLRAENCRVVCFFDANIYYTLCEHGVTTKRARHEPAVLEEVFGLQSHEIYVVPSGVQADRFVLTTLRHLPQAFAVTNDKFRDYAKQYAQVMKGDQWRKGVMISKNEIKMHKHRFKTPVYLNG